jgi:hypothetical protein
MSIDFKRLALITSAYAGVSMGVTNEELNDFINEELDDEFPNGLDLSEYQTHKVKIRTALHLEMAAMWKELIEAGNSEVLTKMAQKVKLEVLLEPRVMTLLMQEADSVDLTVDELVTRMIEHMVLPEVIKVET